MRAPSLRQCLMFARAPLGALRPSLLVAAVAVVPIAAHAQNVVKPDLSPTAAAHSIETWPPQPISARAPEGALRPSPKPATYARSESSPSSVPAIEDPELPGLERRADGSYRFQGTNFRAVIANDGQVIFHDQHLGISRPMKPLPPPPVDRDPTPNGALYQRSSPALALQLRIDLQGYLMKRLGNDPYRSERTWFMDRTRELRESLSQRAVSQSVREILLKIWSDAGLSLAARKRETFELWNHTTDGEDGQQARQVVQEFVRQRCPVDSSCAFRPADLRQFNEKRLPKEPFSPYGKALRSITRPTRLPSTPTDVSAPAAVDSSLTRPKARFEAREKDSRP
jgi:hypothetical protein